MLQVRIIVIIVNYALVTNPKPYPYTKCMFLINISVHICYNVITL